MNFSFAGALNCIEFCASPAVAGRDHSFGYGAVTLATMRAPMVAGGIQRVAANRARDRALEAVVERARQSGIWDHDWQLEQFAGPGDIG